MSGEDVEEGVTQRQPLGRYLDHSTKEDPVGLIACGAFFVSGTGGPVVVRKD